MESSLLGYGLSWQGRKRVLNFYAENHEGNIKRMPLNSCLTKKRGPKNHIRMPAIIRELNNNYA